ncbi:hypothetical protein [Roseomonas mucosa]|uniref:hypothetical protein n=1 Tax=Roseomonas mucosa TaxID=207340 RepID=UPI003248B037
MMDDDPDSRGISGSAGYLLGRMAAERDLECREWLHRVFPRRSGPQERVFLESDVVANIAEWEAAVCSREVIIAQLRARDTALASERDQWRDYAKAVEGEWEELKEQFRSLTVNANLMVDRLDEYDRANEALEAEVEALRAEIARLKGSGG